MQRVRIVLISMLLINVLAGCFAPAQAPPPDEGELSQPESGWEREGPDGDFPSPPKAPESAVGDVAPDFTGAVQDKRRQNPDTVGWISIPDTTVDDVVLQNPAGETNDYYLNLSFDGEPDRNGVYCADRRATFGEGGRGELSRITALYGHSWDDNPDGTLFSQLKKYRDPDFARAHPYIFFSTVAENMVWEVIAVFDTTIYMPYIIPDLSEQDFRQMLRVAGASSIYDYQTPVRDGDKLLVLSTCTQSVPGYPSLPAQNDYRFVVMARLVDPEEPFSDEAAFLENPYPIPPDATLVYQSMWR